MKRITKYILLFIFPLAVLSCFSCASGNKGKELSSPPALPKSGVIHEKIICYKNPDLSYALYLPTSLHPDTKKNSAGNSPDASVEKNHAPVSAECYPVILAFDSHGSGLTPVKMYQELAEKYGFIILGSNDSHNGLNNDQIAAILSGMFEEINTRFPVDTNQEYVMGFSGGARIACLAAMMYPRVKSVIGCGAGFPQGNQPPLYKFDYFGIVGAADFNLNEMMELDGMLGIMKLRHYILTFPGPHTWPPAAVMEDGFRWNILNAMKDNRIKKDDRQIDLFLGALQMRIDSLKNRNRLIEASAICNLAVQSADGLRNTTPFRKKSELIAQNPVYKKQVSYHDEILKKEKNEQQELMEALFSKDISWWKERIKKLTMTNPKMNPEDTLMNARLGAFLSLLCYSNVNAAMNQRNAEMAEKLVGIYQLADPKNPEPYYLKAVILMQRNDTVQAMKKLEEAVSKGFSDKNRLLGQPEFEGIKNETAFFDLMKKIK